MNSSIKKILVLDDEPIITDTLSNLLDLMMDCEVKTYNHPLLALEDEWLNNQSLDLVISDFMMPEIDGFEFLKAVELKHPKCLSILLTGYADKNNAIKCINEINLYYYLEKPWQNDDLMKIIENAFEKQTLEKRLADKVVALEKSNNEVSRLYEILQTTHDHTLNENTVLQESILIRNFHLQAILDYVDEGFFMVDEHLIIQSEYSQKCLEMFKQAIENKYLPELLYPYDVENQNFLKDLMSDILEGEIPRELLLPLLPEQIHINQKIYALGFYFIDHTPEKLLMISDKMFIVTLFDISESMHLKEVMEEEHQQFDMILEVYRSGNAIKAALKDYHHFSQQIPELLSQNIPDETKIRIIFRQVHTFKGMFSQLKMKQTVDALHALESKILEIEKSGIIKSISQLSFNQAIDKDLEILERKLGLDFVDLNEAVVIDKEKLIHLESQLMPFCHEPHIKSLLEEIQSFRFKSFKNLLEPFDNYIQDLSEKLNKPMDPFVIEGEDFEIDQEIYRDFTNSLVHVVRNMMDHGIEAQEERSLKEKPLSGKIQGSVRIIDEHIQLILKNDGCPIDPEVIKEKAHKKGLKTEPCSKEEVLQLIFEADISTSDEITSLSGRGIGLAAVKHELLRLGGRVKISSDPNETQYEFMIPLYKGLLSHEAIENVFIRGVSLYLERYGSTLEVNKTCNTFDALWMGVEIPFDGLYSGVIHSFVQEASLTYLAEKHGFHKDDLKTMKNEVFKEIMNTLIGNGLGMLPGNTNMVEIGIPKVLEGIPETSCNWYTISNEKVTLIIRLL
ncbi:MAG: response regulator [Clostridia bacterium]|nr:response regulator [Clostridia bacterium]